MTRAQNAILFLLCSCFLGIVVVLGYWRVFPVNPVEFDVKNIQVKTTHVKPGGELVYTLMLEKFGIFPAVISSTLIDCDNRVVYALSYESGALPPGKYTIDIEVEIPKRVNPGRYKLHRIYLYTVNPATIVVKHYETPCFYVER